MNKTKKCKHCQSDIDAKAKICPVCKKKQKGIGCIGIIAVIIILIAGIAMCSNSDTNTTTNNGAETQTATNKDDGKLTLAKFESISNGMTYDEVIAIIGSEGTIMSEVGVKGEAYYTVTYQYDGDKVKGDLGANAILLFQDGKLNTKSQIGLK